VRFFLNLAKKYISIHNVLNIILTIMLLTQCTLILYYYIITQCICNTREGVKLRKPSIFVINWFSSCLSFFQSASPAPTYIFTTHTCTTSIITLEPCALNADISAYHTEILKKFHYFADTTERGVWGWKKAQRQGEDRDFTDNSIQASSYHLKLSSASWNLWNAKSFYLLRTKLIPNS